MGKKGWRDLKERADGCELLIITHPDFQNAADTLAAWKIRRGIYTKVANTTTTGNTTNDIESYIDNAYNNWNPAPSYLLFIGDAEFIPTWYKNWHPDAGDPYFQGHTGTDFFYADIEDPPTYVPEFGYGRLSVDTDAEADSLVARIIRYERKANPNSYYTHTTMACCFQDGSGAAPDGIADRRFAKTSEDIRNYLDTQGYTTERIYTTYNAFNGDEVFPEFWNDGPFVFENDIAGEEIPESLQKPNFPWNGSAADITNAINSGRFFITHRDHGSRSGWGDPAFNNGNVDALNNGEERPIVWTINCQTGWFDNETDDAECGTGQASECFVEHWIRHSTGGSCGLIGATRISYSGINDRLVWGWMDAIWPTFTTWCNDPYGAADPIYKMGDVLNYGKEYMRTKYALDEISRTALEEFHWFGDPTMEMWTSEPNLLTSAEVTSGIVIGTSSITVQVTPAIENMLVAVCTENADSLFGTAETNGAGIAIVDLNHAISMAGTIYITVTKHDYLPYEFSPPSSDRYYVDIDAGPGGNGLSWVNAYDKLQDALNYASLSPGDQIWVAEGTYYPDEGVGQTGNDRTSTFNIPTGVEVYGGFAGDESQLSSRDWETNETILSGDIDAIPGDNTGNAYHVVYFHNVSDTTMLDGFTITAGNANGSGQYHNGGGIYNNGMGSDNSSNPQITNCTISGNYAWYGGGMYNDGYNGGTSSPTLTNCTISGNSTDGDGGGMFNEGSSGGTCSPTLNNCTISGNISTDGDGGGIYNDGCSGGTCSPTLINCTISGNSSSEDDGGGMYNDGSDEGSTCNPILINCTVSGNSAGYDGGGMYNNGIFSGTCNPTLTNCTISGNSAYDYGGGMCNSGYFSGNCSPILTNCTISGNSADEGGGMLNDGAPGGNANPILTNCILWNDNARVGNEVYNCDEATPSYSYCDIEGSGSSSSWDTGLGTDLGNNIDSDPLFQNEPNPANAPQVVADHDLLLSGGSPCLGAGSVPGSAPATDKDGRDRPLPAGAPYVDMGAFEQYSDGTLPVVLSTFTAQFIENIPTLYWSTQSETDNMGWFVYRNEENDFTTSEKISEFIEGHGTTSQQQSYIYEDSIENPKVGDTYYYWLESIDFCGLVNHYDKVAVLIIPEQCDPGSGLIPEPELYGLLQNQPNPVVASTKISFNLHKTAKVELDIFNLKGQLVKSLYSGVASSKTLDWNGKGDSGKELAPGIYLYKLLVNGKISDTKKLILMK